MKKYIKIVGARRTGTNLVTRLLFENFDNLKFLSTSKHTPLDEYEKWMKDDPLWHHRKGTRNKVSHILADRWSGEKDGMSKYNLGDIGCQENWVDKKEVQKAYHDKNIFIFICVKNPYSWILSHSKWQGYDVKNGIDYNQCHAYNQFYQSALNDECFAGFKKILIPSEQLIQMNSEKLTDFFEKSLETSANKKIELYKENVATSNDHDKKFNKNYYLNYDYFYQFRPDHVQGITNNTDWNLFSKLGYSPLRYLLADHEKIVKYF